MSCHTSHQSTSRKAIKLKSVNDMHVIVYLKPYLQPKTIKIVYKIFTKFKVERPIYSSKTYLHLKYLQIFSCFSYIYIYRYIYIYDGIHTLLR